MLDIADDGADTAGRHLPTMHVSEGSNVSILGSASSGKTRFCFALAGLGDDAVSAKRIVLDGIRLVDISAGDRAKQIGFVPADAALALSGVKLDVEGELELAWRLLGRSVTDLEVSAFASLFGLKHLLSREPYTLSGGECARLALAISTVKRPKLLIMDQVVDHLDDDTASLVRSGLAAVLPPESVVVETRSRRDRPTLMNGLHVGDMLRRDAVTGWEIAVTQRAGINARGPGDAPKPAQTTATAKPPTADSDRECQRASGDPILRAEGISYKYGPNGFELGPVDLTLHSGERVALVAPSGAGKTTLLKCLALLLPPRFRRLEILTSSEGWLHPPKRSKHLHNWARAALYCFQRPEDQLYLATVRAELLETARRVGNGGDSEFGLRIADHFGLTPYLEKSPFDISRAQQRLLTIAGALTAKPPVLLLDEPSASLDDTQVNYLVGALEKFAPQSGIVIISHDREFLQASANRTIHLSSPLHQGDAVMPTLHPM